MARVIVGGGTAEFLNKNSCRVSFWVLDTITKEKTRMRKVFRVENHRKDTKQRCIREYREELEQSIALHPNAEHMTFGAYADEWLSQRKANPDIAQRTYSRDRARIQTLKLHFGNVLLREISRPDVKRFQTAIMTADENGHAPTASGKPLSGTTARGVCVAFRQIIKEAMRDKYIMENPCDGVQLPKNDTEEKEPLTLQQVAAFRTLLDSGAPKHTTVALRLCLFAGLRRGEVLGLRWSDFDTAAGTISINRSLCSETLLFRKPKTKAGVRTIPLDKATADYLRTFKASQSRKFFKLGMPIDDACICSEAGKKYMHPENLTKSVRRFGNAIGIAGLHPHQLRHTYCTMLFNAGVDLKTVQYLMGHEDIKTTLAIYAHYCNENGVKAAAAVDALIGSIPSNNVVQMNGNLTRWGIQKQAAI